MSWPRPTYPLRRVPTPARLEIDSWYGQVYIYVGGSLPVGTNLVAFRYLFDKERFERSCDCDESGPSNGGRDAATRRHSTLGECRRAFTSLAEVSRARKRPGRSPKPASPPCSTKCAPYGRRRRTRRIASRSWSAAIPSSPSRKTRRLGC